MIELDEVRSAFICWQTSLDEHSAEQALIAFKSKLDLCSYTNCLCEARLMYNHKKWCKIHYNVVTGEAN